MKKVCLVGTIGVGESYRVAELLMDKINAENVVVVDNISEAINQHFEPQPNERFNISDLPIVPIERYQYNPRFDPPKNYINGKKLPRKKFKRR